MLWQCNNQDNQVFIGEGVIYISNSQERQKQNKNNEDAIYISNSQERKKHGWDRQLSDYHATNNCCHTIYLVAIQNIRNIPLIHPTVLIFT